MSGILDYIKTIFNDKETDGVTDYDSPANREDDMELIAVIAAAIASSTGMELGDFRVKSIVRIPETSPVWARIGRQELIHSRL